MIHLVNQKIAVIGIGSIYPGSKNVKELWFNILSQRRQFREMPNNRLPISEYQDENNSVDKTYSRHAAVIDGYSFDWAKNRIPKSTYESSDIVHWLALDVATQALQDAGYNKGNIPKMKTGVIVGNSLTGEMSRSNNLRIRWPFVQKTLRAAGLSKGLSPSFMDEFESHMESIYKSVFPPVTEDSLAGWLSNTIAGRICNFYDLHGGGYVVDGACSSSLLAVATAADKLIKGDLDIALAGGVDISLDTFEIIGFAKAGALTKGDMNVYDRNSSGFIPGEGSGFILLKRLEDAERDGDYIYATINGWGVSSDGQGGITAPKVSGQALALRRAYEAAGYSPHQLDFIEGHGTGTKLGDFVELEAIAAMRDSFGQTSNRSCGVTSFKSLVGHTKAAAGIGGLIKAILAVNQRILPPTSALFEPNDVFQTTAKNIYPILQGEVQNPEKTMHAGVSAMGFGGINCHVTIGSGNEPKKDIQPSIEPRALMADPQDSEIMIIAADSQNELTEKVKQLLKEITGISIAELIDLSYHLIKENTAKNQKIKLVICTNHPDQLLKQMNVALEILESKFPNKGLTYIDQNHSIWIGNEAKKQQIGFLYPGQGSQSLNMSKRILDRYPWARNIAEKLWAILPEAENTTFKYIEKAENKEEIKKWKKALAQTEIAQPAITLSSVLWTKLLEKLGIKPNYVAGHSLGELSAFYTAGGYDEETLFKIAAVRGSAMAASEDTAGGMISLSCSRDQAEKLLHQVTSYAVVANINSPNQTIIAGEQKAIKEVEQLAKQHQLQAVSLPVSNAFHSRLIEKAATKLQEETESFKQEKAFSIPVISGVDGKVMPSFDQSYFAHQALNQVDFISLFQTIKTKCDLLIEVGPGRVLTGLVNANRMNNEITCLPTESSVGTYKDLHQILAVAFIHGTQINWDVLFENRSIQKFVPAYNREFITSPCELPLTVPEVSKLSSSELASSLPQHVLKKAGIPETEIEQYLENRGNFLADVMKADYAHMGNHYPSFSNSEVVTAINTFTENDNEEIQAQTQSTKTIEQKIIELAALQTGFDLSTIQLQHRLLDDLNLDSIKSAEFVASIAKELSISHKLDPTTFANAELKEIVEQIKPLLPNNQIQPVNDHSDIIKFILDQVVAVTGFPLEALALDLRLLDDLNLDSIKSAELIASVSKKFEISHLIDPTDFANAQIQEIINAVQNHTISDVPSTSDNSKSDVKELLYTLIEKITGFPSVSLSDDLRLLDDLNLDSIKSAELISSVAKNLEVSHQIDPTLFANEQLGNIVKQFQQLSTEVTINKLEISNENSTEHNWIRNFAVKYVATQKPYIKNINLSTEARFLILTENQKHPLPLAFKKELEERQVFCHVASFFEAEDQNLLNKNLYTHLIVVSPEQENDNLQQIITRLLSAVRPVKNIGYQANITYIQYGDGFFGETQSSPSLSNTTAKAFASSLHFERPTAKIRVIDLSASIRPKLIVKHLIAEICAEEAFLAVGYDKRKVRRIPQAVVQSQNAYQPRNITWTQDDVILVTGGGQGITAECALDVAQQAGTTMVLVGRTPINDAIQNTLNRYNDNGLVAHYYTCDITDLNEISTLISTVQKEIGSITGVIHGAGLIRSRRAEQITSNDFMSEISPKLIGAMNIAKALENNPPKLFVGFTSITGVTGMSGNSAYGFANEALQLFLRRYENQHRQTKVLSIAFSIWDSVGMGTRDGSISFLKQKGVHPIPVEEGVKRFSHLFFHDPEDKQIVVAAKIDGLNTWNPRKVKQIESNRFITNITHFHPEVSIIARTNINLIKDSYVQDHIYNGTPLFPTVFGLEAMAQAVAHVTGVDDFTNAKIQNISLELPIPVNREHGIEIEIRAEVLENSIVSAEIRTEQTGFQKVHFSADFVLSNSTKREKWKGDFPNKALPIHPKQDLYGSILFQGSQYQKIKQIYALDYNMENHTGYCLFSSSAEEQPERYLLGDPYFHDTLLQSGLLITTQDKSLPIKIESFSFFPKREGTWKIVSALHEKQNSQFNYQVNVLNEKNQIIQQIQGYKTHILAHDPSLPTTKQLSTLEYLDEQRLTQTLKKYSTLFSMQSPHVALAHLPNIHQDNTDTRHERIQPLFQRVQKLIQEDNLSLNWNQSGKPVLLKDQSLTDDYHISFSHDDEISICTVGNTEQGCDIMALDAYRDKSTWLSLLPPVTHSLFQQLLELDQTITDAGYRIWTVFESVKKASNTEIKHMELVKTINEGMIFEASTDSQVYMVMVFPIMLSLPIKRMVAVTVSVKDKIQVIPPYLDYTIENKKSYDSLGELHPEYGFVYRFAPTFPVDYTMGRHIDSTSYAGWMGMVRELSLTSIRQRVRQQFATGKWGMITKNIQVEIIGEAHSSDVLEVHMLVEKTEDTSLQIVYYWYRLNSEQKLELVARSRQTLIWVEIFGSAKNRTVTISSLPNYLRNYVIQNLQLKDRNLANTQHYISSLLGEHRFDVPISPTNQYELYRTQIQTSLKDSDLVGNIFFSNYANWQTDVRDQYFYHLAPQFYQKLGTLGEWITINSEVHYLRESVPFDQIEVAMSLKSHYQYGFKLHFDFYKVEENQTRQKIAFGSQEIAWMTRDEQKHLQPREIPNSYTALPESLLKI